MSSTPAHEYLAPVLALAKDAGGIIMHYFSNGFETIHKKDQSPVTDADIAASTLISQKLAALAVHIPIITEEDNSNHHPPAISRRFWLVDPLDGTRSFVRGEKEFTVNIALIENNSPVLGVIYSPADKRLYYASAGQGAFRSIGGEAPEKIHSRHHGDKAITLIRSRSQPSAKTQSFLEKLDINTIISSSSSIKFCKVAEGRADIYPRFGRTMEWDTAAGHAILNEAGGHVHTEEGAPLVYGKMDYVNPAFIAYGA